MDADHVSSENAADFRGSAWSLELTDDEGALDNALLDAGVVPVENGGLDLDAVAQQVVEEDSRTSEPPPVLV